MPGGNQITFGVGFNVNESGLNKLKQSLQEIQKLTTQDLLNTGNFKANTVNRELASIKNSASQVQAALTRAFNPQLGVTNVAKFNQEMQRLDVGKIAAQFNSLGAVGQSAFLNLTRQSLALNTPLKQNVSWLTKMGETLANTVKWRIATTAVNGFTSAVQGAFNYIKALDSSLTDIRIVTGQSREEMATFADQANAAAQALGRQTKEYTNAALAYYQQGLSDQEVQQRTEATLKAQNITGSGTEMTDYLTAVWNGYKVVNDEIELYVDKLAAVADSSASNMAELATGMSKVAATANNMGVDIDQLTAQLATIIATTRQAPETVGNALKTIYARINDIKAGTDEADISLGNYTKKMAALGFNVLDSNNELRATGEVMEEIGERWQNLTREQQIYLAQTMAGQRQMNNLIALFDNWEQYSEMLNVSLNAQGTLNEKNSRYMESVTAHINQFKAATEGMQQALLDPDGIIEVYDAGTKLMELLTSFIESIGGMKGVLIGLGALGTQVFGKQITEALTVAINNLQVFSSKLSEAKIQQQVVAMFDVSKFSSLNNPMFTNMVQGLVAMQQEAARYRDVMTEADRQVLDGFMAEQVARDQAVLQYKELTEQAIKYGNASLDIQRNFGFDTGENFQLDEIFNLDAENQEQEIKRLTSSLTLLREEYDQYRGESKDLIQIAHSHRSIQTAIEQQTQKITEQTQKVQQLEQQYQALLRANRMRGIDSSTDAATQKALADLELERQKLQDLQLELDNVSKKLTAFKESLSAAAAQENAFGSETERVRTLLDQLGTEGNDDLATLSELLAIFERGGSACAQYVKELNKMIPALQQIRNETDASKSAWDQFIQNLQTKSLAQNLTSLVQGVSSLAMAWQSVTSVVNTYKQIQDGTIDSMEGWTRIIMGASMAITTAATGFKNLAAGVLGLGSAIGRTLAASTTASSGLRLFGLAASTAERGIGGVVAQLGLALPVIGGVAAAVYGLIKAFQAVYNWLTKNNKAYKDSQKALEENKTKTGELKSEYNELKATIEDYQAAQHAISELTKGTEEWRDAIEQSNRSAEKLLELWPELASKARIDADGNIIIPEEDLAAAQRGKQQEATRSGLEGVATNVTNAKNKVGAVAEDISAFRRDIIEDVGRYLFDQEDLKTAVLNNWDAAWDAALDALGKNPSTVADRKKMYEFMLQYWGFDDERIADLMDDKSQNLNAPFVGMMEVISQYSNNWQTVLDAVAEESTTMQGATVQAINELQLLLDTTDYAHKGLVGAIAAQALKDKNGEIDLTKFDNVVESLDQYNQIANEIAEQLGTDTTNALTSFISGVVDFSDLTAEQMNQLHEILLQNAELLHLDDTFEEVFASGRNSSNDKIAAVRDSLVQSVQNIFDGIDMPANKAQQVGDMLTKAYAQSGQEGAQAIGEALKKIPPDALNGVLDALKNVTADTTLDALVTQLDAVDIASDGFIAQLEIILGLFREAAGVNFDTLAASYKDAKDVSEDLHYGDSISADDYDKLLKFNESLADFFEITSTGEYKLKTSGEALNKTIDNFDTDKLVEGLAEANKRIAELEGLSESSLHRGEQLTGSATDRVALTEQANYLSAIGGAGSLSADQAKAYATILKDGGTLKQTQIDELQAAADAAGTLKDLMAQAAAEAEKYATALRNSHELDADVSTEELERRAKYLAEYGDELLGISDDLQNNHEAAALIAEDFLRAEKAAERVADKMEEWVDAIQNATRGSEKYLDAIEELDNTYKDLLNLSEDAHLSENFLTSAENMELLNKAIQGGEEGLEAYTELADAAQQDIINQGLEVKIPVDSDIDISALSDQLMTEVNSLESMLDPIEIGTDLSGDDQLMAKFNEIINAAGLTADQATALLASMGVDAEVVTGPPIDEQNPSHYSWVDPAEYTIEQDGEVGDGAGGTFPHYSARLTKPATLETETGTQTDTSPASFALHVENAKKGVGSGGNINQRKASGLGGGGGRKGGGGGGKNKQPKQKTTKKFKAKIDPYHDVNIKIGDVKEGLDKLEKQRDKLIGKDAVDNLTKQINLLEKEKELLQEKAKIAQGELQKQAQELAQQGAIIDNQGNILNYNQLLKDKQDQINKAIEVANGLTDEQQEAYLKYVDQLKDEYKELEEGIKNLDDTKQLLDDLGADYQDLIDKQIELAIEAFDLKINVELDLQDAEKDFNEFRKKVIDKVKDDEHGRLAEAAARNYSQYYNNNGGLVPELTNHINQIQKEIEVIRNGGFSQIYGDNLSTAADDLKKYNDELMNALEEAQEVIDETHDHFLDAIDAMNDAFDTQQDNLDKIDDLLQHDMDILQLIHGEENYDEMQNLWNQQVAQDNARLQALQKEQQYWRDRVDQYTEGTDEWKKAMENWQDAFEKTNDAMMTSVQNLQARWENSINSIMSTLRNQTYGGNMAAALEDWDKILWHDDRYLDPLERATGLMDLQSKYRDAIRGTNDPKLQQKLADLEEKQLNALAEKEHLREIDLRISEQQLAVMQAQMALEDAQQAKTKLRLRRDSQGNYTYQYVADEENIEEKTQEYAKALADYRELVKESLHDDLQDLSDYTQEFYDKMQEAQMAYGDDTQALMEEQERLYEMYMGEDGYITNLARDANLSMQDLQEATFIQATGLNEMLRDDLFDKFLGPNAEMKEALNNLLAAGGEVPTLIDAFLNDTALRAFDDIDQKSKEVLFNDNEGLFPEWQSALVDLATNYQTEFVPRVIDAMNYLQQANQSYVDGLAIMQGAANRTTENIALGLAYDTFYTNSLNDATNALLQTQDAELQSAEKVYNALKKNEEAFKDQTLAATDAANAMFLYWLALNGGVASNVPYSVEGLSNVNIQMPRITPAAPAYSGGDYSGGGDYGGSDIGTTSAPSNSSSGGGLHGSVPVVGGRIDPYTGQRLATGGYTGEWNNEPRLAWLDQKELVLNADDTKNMLDAVQIVRTIADKVSAATTAAAASIGGSGLADLVSAAGESILQNVVINADFPAVQDTAQIKQAFNELVNLASQRASGNRRTY